MDKWMETFSEGTSAELLYVCIYYCRLTTVFLAMSKPLCVAVVDRFFNHVFLVIWGWRKTD